MTLDRMSMRLCSISLLCLALSALSVSAQEAPAAFLKRSLAAYGDTERIQTVAYTFEGHASNLWQAKDPHSPEALPTKATVVLRLDRGDFRSETEQRFPGGYLFHFVTIAEGPTALTYDVPGSRVGKALFTLDAETRAQELAQAAARLPFWTLKNLLAEVDKDPAPFSLRADKDGALHLKKAGAPNLEYIFDARTLRLNRVETTRGTSTGDKARSVTTFSQERRFDGVWQPTRIQTTLRGKITSTDSVDLLRMMQINTEPEAVSWKAPSDRVAALASTALEVERVSDTFLNIFDPDSGRNLPFARVGQELIAFDAPLAPGFCDRALAEVRKQWPEVHPAWVVITHFHNDHVAGLARYVREGARIACSAAARPMLEAMLRLQGVPFSKATFHLVSVGHPDRSLAPDLDLYDVPNAHVKGMVMAHLPKEGLIYQGDLVSLPLDGTLTPALSVTRDFFTFLKAHPLAYTRMIGHHGNSHITPALMHTLEQLGR